MGGEHCPSVRSSPSSFLCVPKALGVSVEDDPVSLELAYGVGEGNPDQIRTFQPGGLCQSLQAILQGGGNVGVDACLHSFHAINVAKYRRKTSVKLALFVASNPSLLLSTGYFWNLSCYLSQNGATFAPMPRKKMGLEQRLNFWVSQETYDFYDALAAKRGEKVSELLRQVLDRAQKFFDEGGNYLSDLPMSQEELKQMMREVAREESRKVLEDPTVKGNLERQWENRPGPKGQVEEVEESPNTRIL